VDHWIDPEVTQLVIAQSHLAVPVYFGLARLATQVHSNFEHQSLQSYATDRSPHQLLWQIYSNSTKGRLPPHL